MAFVKKHSSKKIKKHKRVSRLDVDGINYIDYKDTELLEKYINTHGKILPSKITGVSAKRQRMLSLAIKRAREMALIPYSRERVRSARNAAGSNRRERVVVRDEASTATTEEVVSEA